MAERPVDLGWLRILAEIGRLGNLSAAARALGLTQPAVSYQIRRLEEQMNVSLLQRRHRGVELTVEGRRLFDVAARTVGDVDALARSFRNEAERSTVRLRTDYAFSSLWLIPRMHGFRQLYPGMDIQIVATQFVEQDAPDASDAAIVFGSLRELGGHGILLLPEKVVPVCSPGFAERHGPLGTPERLSVARLLHLDARGTPPWFDWTSYLDEFAISRNAAAAPGEISFNTYSLVVQAAVGEQGVAIGWMGLVDSLLASGMLVAAGPMVEASDRGYWLVPPKEMTEETGRLIAWLQSEVSTA